jgi:glycosyltransferase involved in cell wall biosynthesis
MNYKKLNIFIFFTLLFSGYSLIGHFKIDMFSGICELLIWKDFNELKDQINTILADPTIGRRIGNWGHQAVLERFTFEKMGQNILELYNKYNGN